MKSSAVLALTIVFFVFSCSKRGGSAALLTGHWALTRQCVCSTCTDSISESDAQTLDFTSDGKIQLTGDVSGSRRSFSGDYLFSGPGNTGVLNVTLDAPDSFKHFLFIPGAEIISVSSATLVLNMNTPYANPCQYQNQYTLLSR